MLYCTVVCRIKLIKRGRDYMNNKKKLLSIITALAITASAFTGFAVTAIAENTDEQPIKMCIRDRYGRICSECSCG